MLNESASLCEHTPALNPNAARIARLVAEAPRFTPAKIARLGLIIGPITGCPCGCTSAPGYPDPECARLRPVRVTIDYSQQCEARANGWPVSA